MYFFALLSLLGALFTFFLGTFILAKSNKQKLNLLMLPLLQEQVWDWL